MPCSFMMKLAKVRASMSSMPHSAPNANAVSYSSPPEACRYSLRLTTVKWVGLIFAMRPHAMVQPKHALLVTRLRWPSSPVARIAFALIFSVPSNCTSRELRVGSPPQPCMLSIIALVPYFSRPRRPGSSQSLALVSATTDMKRFGSSTVTPFVPRTAMALSCFEPMTAPTPERPAARCRSFTTHA